MAESFFWLPGWDTPASAQNGGNSPAWQLPIQNQPSHTISFPYPNTPAVAPPHQQPLSEVNNLNPMDFASSNNGNSLNLGFATLDDWFGTSSSNNQGEQQGDPSNPFGGLDLQDFWMKVGPGEAQGGFPFR
jgi:hypothetical protein